MPWSPWLGARLRTMAHVGVYEGCTRGFARVGGLRQVEAEGRAGKNFDPGSGGGGYGCVGLGLGGRELLEPWLWSGRPPSWGRTTLLWTPRSSGNI